MELDPTRISELLVGFGDVKVLTLDESPACRCWSVCTAQRECQTRAARVCSREYIGGLHHTEKRILAQTRRFKHHHGRTGTCGASGTNRQTSRERPDRGSSGLTGASREVVGFRFEPWCYVPIVGSAGAGLACWPVVCDMVSAVR